MQGCAFPTAAERLHTAKDAAAVIGAIHDSAPLVSPGAQGGPLGLDCYHHAVAAMKDPEYLVRFIRLSSVPAEGPYAAGAGLRGVRTSPLPAMDGGLHPARFQQEDEGWRVQQGDGG